MAIINNVIIIDEHDRTSNNNKKITTGLTGRCSYSSPVSFFWDTRSLGHESIENLALIYDTPEHVSTRVISTRKRSNDEKERPSFCMALPTQIGCSDEEFETIDGNFAPPRKSLISWIRRRTNRGVNPSFAIFACLDFRFRRYAWRVRTWNSRKKAEHAEWSRRIFGTRHDATWMAWYVTQLTSGDTAGVKTQTNAGGEASATR